MIHRRLGPVGSRDGALLKPPRGEGLCPVRPDTKHPDANTRNEGLSNYMKVISRLDVDFGLWGSNLPLRWDEVEGNGE